MSHPAAAAVALSLAALIPTAHSADGLEVILDQARELAARHRYQEVVELLEPLAASPHGRDDEYAVSAELGRAFFHLGRYEEADACFRRAVPIHPERIETALYLQASSFLTGKHDQAMAIFREILRSGATDLYLAVTLSGERAFLAEPDTWAALESHARPAQIELDQASFMGVRLGQDRSAVEGSVGAMAADPGSNTLTARAGPKLLWAFTFDDAHALAEALVDVEHLLRYTPYRLEFDNGLDWAASPVLATASLGPPVEAVSDHDHGLMLSWNLPNLRLTLEFGTPMQPAPPSIAEGAAVLRLVRLRRPSPQ